DSSFVLIHIVESASAKLIGQEAKDYETIQDQQRLDEYVRFLTEKGHETRAVLGFRNRTREIARIVGDTGADLLILGSHGHNTFKDWLFGETINSVRHRVRVPVFIAQ